MPTERDELDEINIHPDFNPMASRKLQRAGRRLAAARGERTSKIEVWRKQLRAIKGRAASQKLKAKVTT